MRVYIILLFGGCGVTIIMPLLVTQRNSHSGVVLDHHHHSTTKIISEQPLDFTMSKFKTTQRHPLYRQFYGAEESPPYDKQEEQGEIFFLS